MEFADDRFMPLGLFGASSIKKNAAYDIPSGSMINITGSRLASVPVISFAELLDGDYSDNFFRNRVVLIGATSQDLRDFWNSPLGVIPGIYLHLGVMETVLNGSWLIRPGTSHPR